MRALRHSPLFRIAILSLAVLFAHTSHAATGLRTFPVRPPCPGKVAAAQPDSNKKLSPTAKRILQPGRLAACHKLFAGALAHPHAASLLALHRAVPFAFARWTPSLAPQRRPFDLRI